MLLIMNTSERESAFTAMNRTRGSLFLSFILAAAGCMAGATDEGGEALSAEPATSTTTTFSETAYATWQSEQAINQYLASVKTLEAGYGVYDQGLGEVLLSLGLAYQHQDRHQEALAVLERSLHISRINEGLYSPGQLKILDLIIDSNHAVGDREALDQNYHYLYWVNRRNFGDDDPRLLPVIDRVGEWYLDAYQLDPNPETFRHLIKATQLYNHAIAIIESHYGPNDERLLHPLYGLVLANYLIYSHALSVNSEDEELFRISTRPRAQELSERQLAIQNMIVRSYRNGKNALQRVIEIYDNNQEISTGSPAQAMVYLGDWYLLFHKRDTAMKSYKMAYKLMDENETPEAEVNGLLDKPQRLPSLQLPWRDNGEEESENQNYVIAAFDVTKSGRTRNIRIIESNPADNPGLRRRTKSTIKATLFRPRFQDGEPVATANVNLRYSFPE